MASRRAPLRAYLVELFAVGNLAFLALDVYLAHLVNDFRHQAEWIPVYFSIIAPVLLLPGLVKRTPLRMPGLLVGGASVLVGVGGMLFHLESSFFGNQTLHNLAYSAPFVAPLSYAGVGLLLLLNRMVSHESEEWELWVIGLGLGGFAGNLVLSLLDHAQNGFFEWSEWIPAFAAAYAIGFLVMAMLSKRREVARFCLWVMGVQVLVALLGFALHLKADLAGAAESIRDRFIFGAPIFAPLLFANLAILCAIGLWHRGVASATP